MSDTLYLIPKIGLIVSYADNILLMAKSESDVVSMSKSLWSALKAHPAGPFQPKVKKFDAGQPIEFLGHRLTPKDSVIHIEANERNRGKFKNHMASELRHLEEATLTPAARARKIQRLRGHVRSWTAAFKLCEGIEDTRANWLAKIPTS